MIRELTFEICVDSVESAIAAERGGAQRIELCSDLLEGGITPSAGLIAQVRDRVTLDINVMIRPRGGDFCYSGFELGAMLHDIDIARQYGANGVVLGALSPDGTISNDTKQLVDRARPLSVTFHRAFDVTRDQFAALDKLIDMGVDRVLTSGGQPTAAQGIDTLQRLVTHANGRIQIMPGSGIREHNIVTLVRQTGAREFHFSARVPVESLMEYRHPHVTFSEDDYTCYYSDVDQIQKIITAAKAALPAP